VLLRRRIGAVPSMHNPVMLNMMMGSAPQRYFLTKKSNVHDWGFFVVVGERFATMVERFNKFNRTMEPGINWKIPFVERVSSVIDLREQVIEISSQVAVTKDNVALHIDGVLYVEV